MKVQRLETFDRQYGRIPLDIRKKVDRILSLLLQDLRHPGIKARKMINVGDIWEARVGDHHRITFQLVADTIVLRRVGTHEIYRNP